jgi:hypothetical protein
VGDDAVVNENEERNVGDEVQKIHQAASLSVEFAKHLQQQTATPY